MLYRSNCCNGTTERLSAEDNPSIDKKTIEALLENIYNNDSIDKKKLLKETFSVFNNGVTKGYGKQLSNVVYNSPDFKMLTELQYNSGVFAAFKNHTQITELVKLLKDTNGKLRPWKEFKTAALKLDEKYNTKWLKVEYDQAVTSARAARRWQDIERTKHLYPNLQYISVQDDRTRALHKKWHGIVLPIGHAFWNTHYTPNDYGCRCTVRRTDKPVNTKGYAVNDMPNLPPQFNQNVGKTGKVYNENHPYFKTKNYKQVASFARQALVSFQRTDIKQFLKQTKATKKQYASQIGKVTISNSAVKELLGKYSSQEYMRNNLLYNVKGLFKEALYIKSAVSSKVNPMVNKYHYLLVKVADTSFYLNVREMTTGEMILYAITDKIK